MLRRRLSLLQAVSLNMSMMVGIGPFITIPALVASLGGPHAMIGWVIGALIALADGLVWSELAAAFPGSGGTYHFFDAAFGDSAPGRLFKFLFVWQFLFSAPLEVATGAIGLSHYVSFVWPSLNSPLPGPTPSAPPLPIRGDQVLALAAVLAVTALAYRRIEAAGKLMVVLWVGMLLTVAWVIVEGFLHFDASRAFDLPPHAWRVDRRFLIGLGAGVAIAMYDYLGYYQVCYVGDEVADPARTLPRSILLSVVAVAAMYLAMNVGILGVLPWREVVASEHVASDLLLRVRGRGPALVATAMVVWTSVAATFAALTGYSRVPYAAARSGHFFEGLARTHPKGDFPHRSLLLIGALAGLSCLADLQTVIEALLTARILVQFVGQIGTVFYLRTRRDLLARMPFFMPLYPLPALLALAGWLFVFATARPAVILYGVGSLLVGLAAFAGREARRRTAAG